MENNYISKPCGGKGTCGKCKIKLLKGTLIPNERDKKFLSKEEINNGYRIACGHILTDEIIYESLEENFNAVSSYVNLSKKEDNTLENTLAIIIDVGTTTLCFQLLSKTGEILKTITMPNSQRTFGADVLSRISKATYGGFSQLSSMLKADIKKGIISLCENIKNYPKNIYIAGNTTMTYFLRNMDCRYVGVYPFENKATDTFSESTKTFFDNNFPFESNVLIFPCIQAFVGGDIVSGAYFLDLEKEKNSLFVDIGTNGEIMLNARGELFSSSVAAGPAFEGGLISCGVGGIKGAINKIKYINNIFEYETIGNFSPVGICGSALIDLLAELLKNNLMDNTGLLKDDLFKKGVYITDNIILKQKDIREIQLAKSAILTGIECILNYANIKACEIEKVFIGGGFGFFLNLESAFIIKMLPIIFKDKIILCGNTSLGGLAKFHTTKLNTYKNYVTKTASINLAETEDFQKSYIENLNF